MTVLYGGQCANNRKYREKDGVPPEENRRHFFRSAQKILRILVDFFLMTLYNKRI